MSLQLGVCGVIRHSGDSRGQSRALLLDLMGLCEHWVHLWDHLERELLWQEGHVTEALAACLGKTDLAVSFPMGSG